MAGTWAASCWHRASWVSTLPITQPPPWTKSTTGSVSAPTEVAAPTGRYTRTGISPAGPGMVRSWTSGGFGGTAPMPAIAM